MSFEVLHGTFVLLRRCFRIERAQILSLPRLGIFLARVQPELARCQFSNHFVILLALIRSEHCSVNSFSIVLFLLNPQRLRGTMRAAYSQTNVVLTFPLLTKGSAFESIRISPQ